MKLKKAQNQLCWLTTHDGDEKNNYMKNICVKTVGIMNESIDTKDYIGIPPSPTRFHGVDKGLGTSTGNGLCLRHRSCEGVIWGTWEGGGAK